MGPNSASCTLVEDSERHVPRKGGQRVGKDLRALQAAVK